MTNMTATLPSSDFAAALDQVLHAAGTDPECPHFMGVLIEAKEGSIRLAATDSFRLAVRDLVPAQLDGDFSGVLPAAALARWRDGLRGPRDVSLRLDGQSLATVGHDPALSAAVVPIEFPDYEKLLEPANEVTRIQVDRIELVAALEHLDDGEPATLSAMASAGAGSLRISDPSNRSTDLDAVGDGPMRQVVLNAGFAADAARHAVGAEVVIEIGDDVSPVLFRSADDGTFVSRIMPIKIA